MSSTLIVTITTKRGPLIVATPARSRGAPGPGVPVGGTVGQVLKKTGAADFQTGWEDESGGPGGSGLPPGGSVGQVVKNTAPGAGDWGDLTAADVGADVAGAAAAAQAAAAADLAAHTAAGDPHPQYATGSEAAGLAAAEVDAHEAAAGAHPISGVSGLQSALDGKEPAGTAVAAVVTHEAAGDPHPQYATDAALTAGLAGKETAGAAAAAVTAHEAAGDPHPQYTTVAEADSAAASAVATHAAGAGAHAIAGVDGLQTALDGKAPASHNHTSTAGDGGALTNPEFDGFAEFSTVSEPSTPAANRFRLYATLLAGFPVFAAKDPNGTVKLLGRDNFFPVLNLSGSTIPAGAAVRFSGVSAGLPTVVLAQANSDATCADGVAVFAIANATVGEVCAAGVVKNLDTSTFSVDQDVFLSASTPGALTATPPTYPNAAQYLGTVLTVNATTGSINFSRKQITPAQPTGVTPGSYTVMTVDGAGRITAGATRSVTGADGLMGGGALESGNAVLAVSGFAAAANDTYFGKVGGLPVWGTPVATLGQPLTETLTINQAPDHEADWVPFYDQAAGANRRCHPESLPPSRRVDLAWGRDDFWNATNSLGDGLQSNNSGGTFSAVTIDADHPGVLRFARGTTAANRGGVRTQHSMRLSAGDELHFRSIVRIATISDGTNRFTIRSGGGDSDTGEFVDGIFFRYVDNVNGGRWQIVCRNNNTETAVDSGVTVTAGAWYNLEFVATTTGVVFLINGTVVGSTITTNIPGASGREFSLYAFYLYGNLGTTDRFCDCDLVEWLHTGLTR